MEEHHDLHSAQTRNVSDDSIKGIGKEKRPPK
jgi:hypothetical protein